MLIHISNISHHQNWDDYFNEWIEAPYGLYTHCYSRSWDSGCWKKASLKPNHNDLKKNYDLELSNWYERIWNYNNVLKDKDHILPTFKNEHQKEIKLSTNLFGGNSLVHPIFFGNDKASNNLQMLTLNNNPIYKTHAFGFILDEYAKTINNDLIIDFTIKYNWVIQNKWKINDSPNGYNDLIFENAPDNLYFEVSYDIPNNPQTHCSFTYPNKYMSDNLFWSGREEQFTINFSGCEMNKDELINIYVSMFSIPEKWAGNNIVDDPSNSENIFFKQEYLLQFDLSSEIAEEVNLNDEFDYEINYPIWGKNNGIDSIEKGFDKMYEKYYFNKSLELDSLNERNFVKDIFYIKYEDEKNHHPLSLPNKIMMNGTGSYEGLEIQLKREYVSHNVYKYVVDDNTYFDPIIGKTVVGKSDKYKTYDGIAKNISSSNINDGFIVPLKTKGYSEREFQIVMPFINEYYIEVEANLNPKPGITYLWYEEQKNSFWNWKKIAKEERELYEN